MRIKSDVEFVNSECEKRDIWDDGMDYYCGREVVSYSIDEDGDYECKFADGESWYYPFSCIEGLQILEKGEKYTVNGSTDYFEFIEESENFAIFKDGYAIEKEGNTFTEYDPKPEFLKKEWAAIVEEDRVLITCGLYRIISICEDGCKMIEEVSDTLDLQIDENGAVKVVK